MSDFTECNSQLQCVRNTCQKANSLKLFPKWYLECPYFWEFTYKFINPMNNHLLCQGKTSFKIQYLCDGMSKNIVNKTYQQLQGFSTYA